MLRKLLRAFRGSPKQAGGSRMDHTLVTLTPVDFWTVKDSYQHLLIMGGVGSGKTNFIGRLFCKGMMQHRFYKGMTEPGFSMFIFCAKPSDLEMYTQWAKETGRERDVIVFEPGGHHSFNIFKWQQEASGGQGVAMNTVAMLSVVLEMIEGQGAAGGQGSDPYWPRSAKELLQYACMLLELAGYEISPLWLSLLVTNAPQDNTVGAPFKEVFDIANWAVKTKSQDQDFSLCSAYFNSSFARLEAKTRGIITSIVTSMIDPFIQSPLRELLATETTITPEEVFKHGKILLINLSPMQYYELGRVGSLVMKYVIQRSLLSRSDSWPVCIWVDEYSQIAAKFDAYFAATCRSSFVSCVSIIQSTPLLYACLGGHERARNEAETLLGIYQTKVFAQSSCPISNTWASSLFAKRLEIFASGGTSYGPNKDVSLFGFSRLDYTANWSESYSETIQSGRFASLRTPGTFAEAIVFSGGRVFKQSGEPYLVTSFWRD